MIKFMLITNDPELAAYAEGCGVGRLFVDLEQHGKKERQGHLDTLISSHSMLDVKKIRDSISEAELLVRVNPLHEDSKVEVDRAIENGADLLMLPMFRSSDEVQKFSDIVDGRVGIVPLLETHDAALAIEDIVKIKGLSEIYIGLNDLHLDMKLKFMFEPLANGLVDQLSETIKEAGLAFGFGGIARVGEGIIPGEMVMGEHVRLKSSSVILSRTFHRKSSNISDMKNGMNLKEEIDKLRGVEKKLQQRSANEADDDYQKLKSIVNQFVKDRTS